MNDDDKVPETKPGWEKKTTFGINEQLKQVLHASREATEAELAQLRRKLEKLTRGS